MDSHASLKSVKMGRVEVSFGNLFCKNLGKKMIWKDTQMNQIWCPMIRTPRLEDMQQPTEEEVGSAMSSQALMMHLGQI